MALLNRWALVFRDVNGTELNRILFLTKRGARRERDRLAPIPEPRVGLPMYDTRIERA